MQTYLVKIVLLHLTLIGATLTFCELCIIPKRPTQGINNGILINLLHFAGSRALETVQKSSICHSCTTRSFLHHPVIPAPPGHSCTTRSFLHHPVIPAPPGLPHSCESRNPVNPTNP